MREVLFLSRFCVQKDSVRYLRLRRIRAEGREAGAALGMTRPPAPEPAV